MTDTASSHDGVIVIGAGPVGLYTAYLLARSGIRVQVFEREAQVLQEPRAISYFPVVLNEFKNSGLLEDVLKSGVKMTSGVAWRRPKSNTILAALPGSEDVFAVTLGQHELSRIILKRLLGFEHASVKFGYTMDNFHEVGDRIKCQFMSTPDAEGPTSNHLEEVIGQYLVAADGGRSTVRKQLSIPLSGFTWEDYRLVSANIDYDLFKHSNWGPANWIVDPDLWAVVAYCGYGTVWRVASAERLDENTQEWDEAAAIRRLYQRLAKLLPGPTETANLMAISPYMTHQRCAETFVHGRIALAGDAAHLTNPVGGLGLTTGLLDAALLARTLQQILLENHHDPATLLETYNQKRREVFLNTVSPAAIANRQRLIGPTEDLRRERDLFFTRLNSHDTSLLEKLMADQSAIASA